MPFAQFTSRTGRGLRAAMADMRAAAAQFPGHMGGFLIPPERGEDGCYRANSTATRW